MKQGSGGSWLVRCRCGSAADSRFLAQECRSPRASRRSSRSRVRRRSQNSVQYTVLSHLLSSRVKERMRNSSWLVRGFLLAVFVCCAVACVAQVVVTNDPPQYGPYNANFLRDGSGLQKTVVAKDTLLRADLPWS